MEKAKGNNAGSAVDFEVALSKTILLVPMAYGTVAARRKDFPQMKERAQDLCCRLCAAASETIRELRAEAAEKGVELTRADEAAVVISGLWAAFTWTLDGVLPELPPGVEVVCVRSGDNTGGGSGSG